LGLVLFLTEHVNSQQGPLGKEHKPLVWDCCMKYAHLCLWYLSFIGNLTLTTDPGRTKAGCVCVCVHVWDTSSTGSKEVYENTDAFLLVVELFVRCFFIRNIKFMVLFVQILAQQGTW